MPQAGVRPSQRRISNTTAEDTAGLVEAHPYGVPAPPHQGKLRGALKDCDLIALWSLMDKGAISNMITFVLMIIGIALAQSYKDDLFCQCVQAFGLFGFSGGITNWLAVKMLFDRVPGLYGSGIITQQFKEIRQTVMDTVLETFFDAHFLGNYVQTKAAQLEDSNYLIRKIREVLESPETDAMLTKHVEAIFTRPEGMMLMMGGFDAEKLKPMVRPFVVGMDVEIAPLLTSGFDPKKMVDAKVMRVQVQDLMRTKMEMLTPKMVKGLVEEMIRTHLGWLVVWGNLFGGLIGLICQLGSWEY